MSNPTQNTMNSIPAVDLASPLDKQVASLASAVVGSDGGSMKSVFEKIIKQGGYDLRVMISRIDEFYISGKLTEQDRDELYEQARAGAVMQNGVDLYAAFLALEERVRKLEESKTEASSVEPYTAGKWYRRGGKCLFDGTVYTCTAPEGAVCTWSPHEYPAYWTSEE